MLAKVFILLLALATTAHLQSFAGGENDPKSEVVFNISRTSAASNTPVQVTCGLKSKDPTMVIDSVHVSFNKVANISGARPIPSPMKQNWTCPGTYQPLVELGGEFQVCRTYSALLIRTTLQPKLAGDVSCLVSWANFLDLKNMGTKRFRGVKSNNLTVTWPSKVDYAITKSQVLSQAPPVMFGPSDVAPGVVNVSCGFIIGSNKVDKPTMSGLDSWTTVYDDNKMNFGGVTTIHIKKTKVVTVADNGTKFECSIGNHTVRRKLSMKTLPRITRVWPAKNSTVFVGSNITCEAEGHPSPDIYLFLGTNDMSRLQTIRGRGKVISSLPLDKTGLRVVTCKAISPIGAVMKQWTLNVEMMPMNVSLSEVRQQEAGTFLNLSCSTPDPDVEKIYLGFIGRSLFELRVNPPAFMETSIYMTGQKPIQLLPYTSNGITVLKVSNRKIDVMMALTREDNGKQVECVAVGKGKRGSVAKNFLVSWPPSVEEVSFEGTSVKRFSNATVRCKFYVGNPALPMEVIRPTATIGSRDLGIGFQISTSPLLSLTWVTQVSRSENGLNVTCSLVKRVQNQTEVIVQHNTVARVEYPPSITLFSPEDEAALLPASPVRCVSDAYPPALVVLSARVGVAPLREIDRGDGEAEGFLEGEEGRYVVVCEAWNPLGTAEESREMVFFARPPPVTLVLSSTPAPVNSTLLVSCFTEAEAPRLRQLELRFPAHNVSLSRYPISTKNPLATSISVLEPKETEPKLESRMPFYAGSKRLHVQRLSALTNRIDVRLTVSAFDHMQNVSCKAVGTQDEFDVAVQKKILVSLVPLNV